MKILCDLKAFLLSCSTVLFNRQHTTHKFTYTKLLKSSKSMKNWSYFVLFMILLNSCKSEMTEEDTFRIGFSQCVSDVEWRQTMNQEITREIFKYPHLKLVMRDAKNDVELQAQQIRELVSEKVDLLIVSPKEVTALTPVLEAVANQGVPIVVVDRKTLSDNYTAFVGADNFEIGKTAAEYAARLLNEKGKVLEIWGDKTTSPAQNRHKGFHEALKKYPQIQVIAQVSGNWLEETTLQNIPQYAHVLDDIQLVYAHNDQMAHGVYEYRKQLKLTNPIHYIGVDGMPSQAIKWIANREQTASLIYPTGGKEAIQLANKILTHQSYQKENQLPTAVIDSTNIRIMQVNAENMQKQEADIDLKNNQLEQSEKIKFYGLIVIILTVAILILVLIGFYFTHKARQKLRHQHDKIVTQQKELKQKQQEILARNEELQQNQEEILAQRDYISQKNEQLNLQKEEISKRFEDVKVLSEIGQKITSSIQIDTIVTHIYQGINQLTDAPNFEVGILNAEHIEYFGFREHQAHLSQTIYIRGAYARLSNISIKTQREIIINSKKDIEKYIIGNALNRYHESSANSMVYMPLFVENRVMGVMVVKSPNENAYSELHINILRNLASYISVALDNAKAYRQISFKNKKITESIRAARMIQRAILPTPEQLKACFKDYFVLFLPKDIVSGDFYWMSRTEQRTFIAVVDCTGHGVPGAFMSMIGSALLNKIVNEQQKVNPAHILELLNKGIVTALRQYESGDRNGMDICFCSLENQENGVKLTYAGAKSPLYFKTKSEEKLQILKPSISLIGGGFHKHQHPFKNQEISLQTNDIVYLSTDGFIDQNNKKRTKFGKASFIRLLQSVSVLSCSEQYQTLTEALNIHQQDEAQRDDITVLGIQI